MVNIDMPFEIRSFAPSAKSAGIKEASLIAPSFKIFGQSFVSPNITRTNFNHFKDIAIIPLFFGETKKRNWLSHLEQITMGTGDTQYDWVENDSKISQLER